VGSAAWEGRRRRINAQVAAKDKSIGARKAYVCSSALGGRFAVAGSGVGLSGCRLKAGVRARPVRDPTPLSCNAAFGGPASRLRAAGYDAARVDWRAEALAKAAVRAEDDTEVVPPELVRTTPPLQSGRDFSLAR